MQLMCQFFVVYVLSCVQSNGTDSV